MISAICHPLIEKCNLIITKQGQFGKPQHTQMWGRPGSYEKAIWHPPFNFRDWTWLSERSICHTHFSNLLQKLRAGVKPRGVIRYLFIRTNGPRLCG